MIVITNIDYIDIGDRDVYDLAKSQSSPYLVGRINGTDADDIIPVEAYEAIRGIEFSFPKKPEFNKMSDLEFDAVMHNGYRNVYRHTDNTHIMIGTSNQAAALLGIQHKAFKVQSDTINDLHAALARKRVINERILGDIHRMRTMSFFNRFKFMLTGES